MWLVPKHTRYSRTQQMVGPIGIPLIMRGTGFTELILPYGILRLVPESSKEEGTHQGHRRVVNSEHPGTRLAP